MGNKKKSKKKNVVNNIHVSICDEQILGFVMELKVMLAATLITHEGKAVCFPLSSS